MKQVEGDFDAGVVAFNLDDLVSESGKILVSPNKESLDNLLRNFNQEFLRSNERHFKKYLPGGRIVAAAVTVNVVADILDWKPHFNNARQTTFWTIPGLPEDKEILLKQFQAVAQRTN